MLETPVLFIIFNRPDCTKKVFSRIREVRPKQLFIAADGPRINHSLDFNLCVKTRKIFEKIDWDCEVKTLLREENLGCLKAVSSAITWFFENVESGIILEDDCLPDLSFFFFCQAMLNQYSSEERVWQVSGTNYLFNDSKYNENLYFFSVFNQIWGWATWRRAWQHYTDLSNCCENENHYLESRIPNDKFRKWLIDYQKIDMWDIYWNRIFNKNDALCITPCVNLVKNIGMFGTHGKFISPFHKMPIRVFDMQKIVTTKKIEIDFEKDSISFNNILYKKPSYRIRILNRLIKISPIFKKLCIL